MLRKIFSVGAAASLLFLSQGIGSSSEVQARNIVKPNATGVGYANNRYRARLNSVRAWRKAVRRRYGNAFANYRNAVNRRTSCEYIGRSNRYKFGERTLRRQAIGSIGNPNSKWACTSRGRPSRWAAGPVLKPKATGIGYGRSRAGAVGRSIRAWTNVVRRNYGRSYADYDRARNKRLSCERIGGYRNRSQSRSFGGGLIGVEGNRNLPWGL